MALQDICNFQDFSILPESVSMPFGKKKTTGMSLNDCTSFWSFYIPVTEFLDETPINFGQIKANSAASVNVSQDPSPCGLSLPTCLPPASSGSMPLPFPMAHGTTTLAFVFQGGVLVAADTRSSCSGLVACPASQKIQPIHSHLVGTTSGTSADCVLWKRILARELRLYQLRYGRRLSTAGAAKLLSHMLHPFKGTELCVAATLCGWDKGEKDENGHPEGSRMGLDDRKETIAGGVLDKSVDQPQSLPSATGSAGPSLYYVCSDGTRLQGMLFSVGSGSPYAYSVLDSEVQWGLTVDEATAVAREAVYRATHRDAYSGNCVDIYHVTPQGWSRRKREDLKEEYYRERKRQIREVIERGERRK